MRPTSYIPVLPPLDMQGVNANEVTRDVYLNGTDIRARIYSDPLLRKEIAQPTYAKANGSFDNCYVETGTYRVVLRDRDDRILAEFTDIQVNVAQNLSGQITFTSFDDLENDAIFSHDSSLSTENIVVTGQIIRTAQEGFQFQVRAPGDADYHVQTPRGLRLKVVPDTGVLNIKAFGAVGDGVTDDTVAIQNALNESRSGLAVLFPSGTYLHSQRLIIRHGTRALVGEGGTLLAANTNCGLLMAGRHYGEAENVSYCDIRDLNFDGNGLSVSALEAQNVQHCKVTGCFFRNIFDSYGMLFRSYLAGARNTMHVTIANNKVWLNKNHYGVGRHAISLDVLNAELPIAPYTDPLDYWNANLSAATPTYFAENCTVEGNNVFGGYYGVSLAGSVNVRVMRNVIDGNTRNISIQHGATHNRISENTLSECASSGIHLATGACHNMILNNSIDSFEDGGEALIQMYRGSCDNVITGNAIVSKAAIGNQYFIYVGPSSKRCRILSNHLTGPVGRAGIALESGWDNTVTTSASYAFNKVNATSLATGDLEDVIVANNVIDLTNTVPAIFLSAVTDANGPHHIRNCNVQTNTISNNTPYKQVAIFESNGSQVSDINLVANLFHRDSTKSRYEFPRGPSHFLFRYDNAVLDTSIVTFASGLTTPDVGFGRTFAHNNNAPTVVTYYTGGTDGQEIVVRLDLNTTLMHNSSKMRLKSNQNIVGTSANQIVRLMRFSGIWFEVGRNF